MRPDIWEEERRINAGFCRKVKQRAYCSTSSYSTIRLTLSPILQLWEQKPQLRWCAPL